MDPEAIPPRLVAGHDGHVLRELFLPSERGDLRSEILLVSRIDRHLTDAVAPVGVRFPGAERKSLSSGDPHRI